MKNNHILIYLGSRALAICITCCNSDVAYVIGLGPQSHPPLWGSVQTAPAKKHFK